MTDDDMSVREFEERLGIRTGRTRRDHLEHRINESDLPDVMFRARLDIPAALEVIAARFRYVGLSEASALSAASGLAKGTYFSFEDAANAKATFDEQTRLLPDRVSEVAGEFPNGAPVQEKQPERATKVSYSKTTGNKIISEQS